MELRDLFRLVLAVVIACGAYLPAHGQNLVSDPGFENYVTCPTNVSDFDGYAGGWVSTGWTPDLYNSCGFIGSATTTNNVPPRTGNGMTGMFQYGYWAGGGLYEREHVIGSLSAPLQAGVTYRVSYFVHPVLVDIVGIGMGVGTMAAYFGDGTLGPPPADNLYPVTPQVVHSGPPITAFSWTEVSGCFVANGGEQSITIANFFTDAASGSVPLAGATAPSLGYVLIDDVTVEALDFDLPLVDITSCDGVPVVLDASSTGNTWTWDDGSTESTLVVDEPGIHWVDIDFGGCIVRDSCTVLIALPPTVELGPDTTFCEGLTLLLSVDDPGGTITWSDGSSNTQLLVDRTGVYSVEIANDCGSNVDSIAVSVEECPCTVFAPNSFTPNADGINDAFAVVRYCPFPIELSIFDRWGELIFHDVSLQPHWDGDDAPPGVYVWRTENVFDQAKKIGHVVLIR